MKTVKVALVLSSLLFLFLSVQAEALLDQEKEFEFGIETPNMQQAMKEVFGSQ